MLERFKSDSGLMGPSHAMSAIAMTLLLTLFASEFMFKTLLGTNDFVVYITVIIIVVGASLMPDLDASTSTSINVLGIIGSNLSTVMRAFSKIIQSTIRSKSDKPSPDPHRGFWHTILAAFIAGGLVLLLTSFSIPLFEVMGVKFDSSMLFVIFIIYISIKLLTASLIKSVVKKYKGNFLANTIINLISLLIAVILTTSGPEGLDFKWVAVAVTLGWLCHLVGDMMTVAGVPILAPFIKFKGKRWWMFRFPFGIKAGGWIEMSILNPLFLIVAIVSAVFVIPMLS